MENSEWMSTLGHAQYYWMKIVSVIRQYTNRLAVVRFSTINSLSEKSPKEFLFAMAFVVPCISIIVCYARIFYIVRKTAMRTHENAIVVPTGSIRIQESAQQQKSNNRTNKANQFIDEANKQLLEIKTNDNRDLSVSDDHSKNYDESRRNRVDANSETSSSNFYPHGTCGSKILLKYIDSSLDSDLPPSLTGLRLNRDEEIKSDHSKGVEFVENNSHQMNGSCDTELKRNHLNTKQTMSQEADSAMDESISSVDNNQVSLSEELKMGKIVGSVRWININAYSSQS